MHRSVSVSRQGTFDTGPAHLDKRGSIRRGDVELPVVEDSRSTSHSADQVHNNVPSEISSQIPATKARSSTDQGPSGSVESQGKATSREPSPRYVDHNKLFPDPVVKPKSNAVLRESGYAASSQDKRKDGKYVSPGRTDQVAESSLNPAEKEETEGDQKHPSDKNTSLVNGETSKEEDDGGPKSNSGSSLKSTDTPKQERHGTNPLASSPGRSPESRKESSPEGGKDVKTDKTTALNRLKAKTTQSSSNTETEHQQHTANNSTVEPRSPRKQQQEQETHFQKEHHNQQKQQSQQDKPQQQQQPEQQTPKESGKQDTKNKETEKAPSKTVHPSLEFIKRKQQQQEQQQQQSQKEQQPPQKLVSTVEAKSHQTEKPQPQQKQQQEQQQQQQHQQQQKQQQHKNTTKTERSPQQTENKNDNAVKAPPASKPSPSPQSSDTPSQQASASQTPTPNLQPSPVLFSTTQQGSAPPQDHSRKVSNPSSKRLDTSKDRKQIAKVTPQSAVKTDGPKSGVKDTPRSEGKGGQPAGGGAQGAGTGEAAGDGVQSRGQSAAVTAMAQGKEGALDSLAQVTSERDQLLRNEKTYKQRILQLEEEVKSAVKQSQDLSADNRVLTNKLEAFETKVYGGSLELKELRREKQDLVTMVAKTTGEKQEMDAENERLRSKLAEADSKSRQWDALYVENNKLKAKQAELEKHIMELDNEKLKLKTNVRMAESTQLDKLAAMQNENKKLQAELINMQTKTSSMERKVERLEADNKDVVERLDQKKTELDELMRAMKTETNVEMELKEVKQELEFAQNKIEDYKKDLNEANRRYEMMEKDKDSAKNSLRLKDSECKGLKAMSEEKDTQIGELKRQVDTAKRNVKRLEDDLEDTKQVEKDVVNMKARVRSLKNEIEDSLAANHKMKQERTEARLEADRLNRELAATSEAVSEARRYIKKLEGERGSRDKLEEEIKARKQREQDLERQTYELNVRNEQLRTKVRILEEEKEELLKRDVNETHAANRRLRDENQKLRQVMVERNMEMVQRQSERHALMDRVDNLERKQNDSDVKVRQLKGWVEDVYTYPSSPPPDPYLPNHHPTLALPPVPSKAARTSKSKAGDGGGAALRRKKGQHLPQQQRQHQLNRSWEDLHRLRAEPDESIRTTPGLPGVGDPKTLQTTVQSSGGYFDLYKNKMKLIRGKKW